MATEHRAQNLREFKYGITKVHPDSIYHHFWGRLLQPSFDEPEYSNDFASWVRHGLRERALAERLSVIDPTEFPDIENLREEIIETIESRLDEGEYVSWSLAENQFYFLRSKLIILDSGITVQTPEQLGRALRKIPIGSVFYHLIDARRRTGSGSDDFTEWLRGIGDKYGNLIQKIDAIDPFFSCLETIRQKLIAIFKEYKAGGDNE